MYSSWQSETTALPNFWIQLNCKKAIRILWISFESQLIAMKKSKEAAKAIQILIKKG